MKMTLKYVKYFMVVDSCIYEWQKKNV